MIRRAMVVVVVSAFALLGFAGAAGAETLSAAMLVDRAQGMNAAVRANAAGLDAGAEALGATLLAKGQALNAAVHD